MIYTTAAGMPQVQQRVEEKIVRERQREQEGICNSHGNGNGINESHMQRLSDDFAALMTCQPAGVEASYNDYPESDTHCC